MSIAQRCYKKLFSARASDNISKKRRPPKVERTGRIKQMIDKKG